MKRDAADAAHTIYVAEKLLLEAATAGRVEISETLLAVLIGLARAGLPHPICSQEKPE